MAGAAGAQQQYASRAHTGGLGWPTVTKTGPNDARRVVWALGMFLFLFFRVLYILTNGFLFYLCRLYLCSICTGGVQMDGDHENGPKRHQTRLLGLRYYLFNF